MLMGLDPEFQEVEDRTPLANLMPLTDSDPVYNQVHDLTSLAHLTGLRYLYLHGNQARDITPLANLTSLVGLHLSNNQIRDLTPLANLTNLEWLDLGWNEITDVQPLVGLRKLERLWIAGNAIEDVLPLQTLYAENPKFWVNIDIGLSPPALIPDVNLVARVRSDMRLGADDTVTQRAMEGLTYFRATWDQITDITGLEHATNLKSLVLGHNVISDLTPLANLTNLTRLGLGENAISDVTPLANLTALESLGLRDNQITDVTPLAGLVNLERLRLRNNPIADLSPLAALKAQNPNLDIDIEVPPPPPPPSQDLEMPDANLAKAVREALDLAPDAPITQTALQGLTRLGANWREITNLTGLEYATNLERLYLSNNQISDLTPLATLTKLTNLGLGWNQVRDLTPLTNLTNLRDLYLPNNQISDLTPLANANLTNLITLNLGNNQVSNLTPLADSTDVAMLMDLDPESQEARDLTTLETLAPLTDSDPVYNQVHDLTPLAHLTGLRRLFLYGNQVSDIAPLANLTSLVELDIDNNQISDLTPLANSVNLMDLDLGWNEITDVHPLVGLRNLERLWIAGNAIEDISPLQTLYAENPNFWVNIDIGLSPPVSIPDANLVAAVRSYMRLGENDTVTQRAMEGVTDLYAHSGQITDITGLEHATNLKSLVLGHNVISDLTPLANLTNLTRLGLGENAISDVTPLANLTALESLGLRDNQITDVTPLAGLVNLERLRLRNNPIADLSPLAALKAQNPNLDLDIDVDITDLLPEKITGPWLWMIAPTEPGQGGADSIDIDSLAAASGGAVTEAAVAANGANIGESVGNLVWTLAEIADTGGDNVTTVVNDIGFAQGDVDDHSSYALITLESATDQPGVRMYAGSDDAIKVWLNGAVVHKKAINRGAEDFKESFDVNLAAGDNLLLVKVGERDVAWSMFIGIDATANAVYKASPPAAGEPESESPTLERAAETVALEDANLAAAIRENLSVPADTPLTTDLLQQLTTLDAYSQGITNLAGLEQATNLTTLDLGANQMTDITALTDLTQLEELYLDENQITDVSPLSGLSNLRLLRLAGNPIADTSPLATLIAENPDLDIDISVPPAAGNDDPADTQPPVTLPDPPDASPAPTPVTFADANLEGAVRAALGLAPEEGLTSAALLDLLTLDVYDHGIVSLAGLEDATNLVALDLGENEIVDVSPLSGLTQLVVLYLDGNQIVDVSPLSGLTNLETLFLAENPIKTLAPIRHIIENLQEFDFDPEPFK